MKIKIHALTSDIHNCGSDTTLFATEAALNVVRVSIMQERIEESLQSEYADTVADAEGIRSAIAGGCIDEAWEMFTDWESNVKHPDDYYSVVKHELEIESVAAELVDLCAPHQSKATVYFTCGKSRAGIAVREETKVVSESVVELFNGQLVARIFADGTDQPSVGKVLRRSASTTQ